MKTYQAFVASLATLYFSACIPAGIPGTGKSGIVGDIEADTSLVTQIEASPSPSPSSSPSPSPTVSAPPPPPPPANVAPMANAGADKAITLPTSSVSVTGSGTDSDGTITNYFWTKVSGAGTQTISSPALATTMITGLNAAGTYVFRLRVTDNDGATATDDVSIVVTAAANVAPTVSAGVDKAITLPTSSVSVTGTASDSDGTIATLAWTKVSGAGTQTFSAASALTTTISGLSAAGTYVFRLTATDDRGGSTSDTVQIVVSAAPNPNPSTNPTPNVSVPVVEGLAPPSSITPCALEVWKRNVAGTSPAFNNFDTVIYVPCDYNSDANKKYPLVISNHGRGGSTLDTATHSTVGGKNFEGFIKQLRNNANLRATYGAIVLAPDLHAVGDGGDYFPGAAQAHRQARLILDAIKYLKVDPKRVTVTGLSYGGSMTIDMMMMYQPLLAGAMPFAMQPPNKGSITAENTCRWVNLPLWAAGKGDDGVFNFYEWSKNFAGGFKYTLERCPGYVAGQYFTLTNTGTGGHTGWDQFYALPEVQNWLMNQVQPD